MNFIVFSQRTILFPSSVGTLHCQTSFITDQKAKSYSPTYPPRQAQLLQKTFPSYSAILTVRHLPRDGRVCTFYFAFSAVCGHESAGTQHVLLPSGIGEKPFPTGVDHSQGMSANCGASSTNAQSPSSEPQIPARPGPLRPRATRLA